VRGTTKDGKERVDTETADESPIKVSGIAPPLTAFKVAVSKPVASLGSHRRGSKSPGDTCRVWPFVEGAGSSREREGRAAGAREKGWDEPAVRADIVERTRIVHRDA
jgi:hypothetical protein